jgi:hypothetical protein
LTFFEVKDFSNYVNNCLAFSFDRQGYALQRNINGWNMM